MFEVLKGHNSSCQRITWLKLEANGELSARARQNLMQLLCQVDKEACLDEDELTIEPAKTTTQPTKASGVPQSPETPSPVC